MYHDCISTPIWRMLVSTVSNCNVWFFLRYHSRVLYIDIDIHHGDGVQVKYNFFRRFF